MNKQGLLPSVFLSLVALAIVYALGSTFFTIELERIVERMIAPHLAASQRVAVMNRAIYAGIDGFIASNHLRVFGYLCFALMVLLSILGLIAGKGRLASLGSVGFILTIYAYFVLHMSFLAGLGVLTTLWAPFWGDFIKLGDIAYLPYVLLVYPFSLIGVDIRRPLAYTSVNLGLLIFILGVLTWFYARFQKKATADFWIYRFTRHPQYLGWIIWSYGLMLLVALRKDTGLQASNPGASLPWVVSTLIILCVALSEEIRMHREHSQEYMRYCNQAPFMLPLPRWFSRAISAPLKHTLRKDHPENGWDLAWTFFIYLGIVMALSLPFVLLDWPPGDGWMIWPF